jgi:membrane-associated protease RseP (regulator of RpoE activity)
LAPARDAHETVPVEYFWQPFPKFRDRIWLHVLLLVLTLVTTTFAGIDHWLSFTQQFLLGGPQPPFASLVVHGFWYSSVILAILGCHELGHYFACRYYDVDASLPFFLPMPLVPTGTLGAVIRIREPIPSKRMLFDIGIAGPIAGFVVAVPALVIGLLLSNIQPDIRPESLPANVFTYTLGEPLLLKLAARLIWGAMPTGYSINLHPMAFAAWFGMLATALNLFPIGQLDGGHISYAVLGRKSSTVTLVMIGCMIVLTWFSTSWLVWTVLTMAMLFFFGRHHPRTFDEDVPLDSTRRLLAVVAIVMFVLCFTPTPISASFPTTP